MRLIRKVIFLVMFGGAIHASAHNSKPQSGGENDFSFRWIPYTTECHLVVFNIGEAKSLVSTERIKEFTANLINKNFEDLKVVDGPPKNNSSLCFLHIFTAKVEGSGNSGLAYGNISLNITVPMVLKEEIPILEDWNSELFISGDTRNRDEFVHEIGVTIEKLLQDFKSDVEKFPAK